MVDFNSLVFDEEGFAEVVPTLIPNTSIKARINSTNDGIKTFWISPCEGYLLHDNRLDEEVIDPDTLEPTGEIVLRYSTETKTVKYDYDFDTIIPGTLQDVSGNTIKINKIGAFEQFAIPIDLIKTEEN